MLCLGVCFVFVFSRLGLGLLLMRLLLGGGKSSDLFALTPAPNDRPRFAFRYLLVTRSFPVRFGRCQTTHTVREFPEHSRSSSPSHQSQPLQKTNGILNRGLLLDAVRRSGGGRVARDFGLGDCARTRHAGLAELFEVSHTASPRERARAWNAAKRALFRRELNK